MAIPADDVKPRPPTSPIWGLLGPKLGDNRQVKAVASALARRTKRALVLKQLHYGPSCHLPNIIRRASRIGLKAKTSNPLAAPWPTFVVAIGRRSAAIALWIKARAAESGHRVQLIQLGRPGAPTAWFDLVVTTPQYALTPAPNCIELPLPFTVTRGTTPPVEPPAWPELPRPWVGLLVGGPTAAARFDKSIATELAQQANAYIRPLGGSLLLVTSPRTPPSIAAALCQTLTVPHFQSLWRPDGPNHYDQILDHADQLVITGDSMSMIADACQTGKPSWLFALPERGRGLRHLTSRPWIKRTLIDTGLLLGPRNYGAVHQRLIEQNHLQPWPPAAHQPSPTGHAPPLHTVFEQAIDRMVALHGLE